MKPAPPVTRIVFKFGRGLNLHTPVSKVSIGVSLRSLGDTGVTGDSVAAGAIVYEKTFDSSIKEILLHWISLNL